MVIQYAGRKINITIFKKINEKYLLLWENMVFYVYKQKMEVK